MIGKVVGAMLPSWRLSVESTSQLSNFQWNGGEPCISLCRFSTRGVAISDDMVLPLTLMSIGAWLLFAYMVMVRTQILYLTDLLHAKKGRLFSQTHFSQTSP